MPKLLNCFLLLMSMIYFSCNNEDDTNYYEDQTDKCSCMAIYTSLNGKEFPAQFWSSNDCSMNGEIVKIHNIDHQVKCISP